MSEFIVMDPDRPTPASVLEHVAAVLAQGGLAVIPTETFYGIAADALNHQALERLAQLKGRDATKPFPLIVAQAAHVHPLVERVGPLAAGLMDRYWPGPLTLVFAAREGLSPRIVSESGGVAVRISPQPHTRGLAAALGRAITATSANPAGAPPPARLDQLDPSMAGGVDVILDSGPCPGAMASTVLDTRADPPVVLRPGPIEVAGAVTAPQ